ncbi:MAG TPA: M61 family peptidase [Acidobacteriota bacterium]|jgi:predicted metalloprotease with PDZ domain|nr:M61 family peptidase [Acidobacteriota bacterium]
MQKSRAKENLGLKETRSIGKKTGAVRRRSAALPPIAGGLLLAVLFFAARLGAYAQTSPPTVTLRVDASEAPRRILHARLAVPAAPGPLTLLYPKWIPGEHGPTGPITNVVGLKMTAAGKTLTWNRDPVDMYAFNCEVPPGAKEVEVALDFLAVPSGPFSSGASTTENLADINWNTVLLYPQGWAARELNYQASLHLPAGWQFGTALPVARQEGDNIQFSPVSLETLVDSPVIAGAHFKKIPINPGNVLHEIDVVADSAVAINFPPEEVDKYKRLVAEANALFGAHHYRGYRFLLTLSDYVASFGLEHHESSDDRTGERAMLEAASRRNVAGLLAHEFVHSWNGKYRRPAGLATPDFQQPMKGGLLWVYEGLTQFLGELLPARSGLWTAQDYRESLAVIAAYLDKRPGRTWRPLADTAVAAQLLYEAPSQWSALRRGVDFYDESVLIWLEADTIIRQQSQGKHSLDDFCRRFHGGQSGPPAVIPYAFEDVVAAMNEVAPYDWRAFFNARLNSTAPGAPLGGVEGSGWKLIYNETPNEWIQAREQSSKSSDFRFSLGLQLGENGSIVDIIPGLPAAQAGVAPGMKLVAVNGRRWSPAVLRDAVKASSKSGSAPLELLVEDQEFYKTYRLDYHGGDKQPHLERDTGRPDLLEQILKPRT